MSPLNEFCKEFGVDEQALGDVFRIKGRCFLARAEDATTAQTLKAEGAGVYLGEEKKGRFTPSPACVELIAAKSRDHKVVVDEKSEWLFLCGRDIFTQGVKRMGRPTTGGLLLIQNKKNENLGYGTVSKRGNVAIKNLLDRGFYLRRE